MLSSRRHGTPAGRPAQPRRVALASPRGTQGSSVSLPGGEEVKGRQRNREGPAAPTSCFCRAGPPLPPPGTPPTPLSGAHVGRPRPCRVRTNKVHSARREHRRGNADRPRGPSFNEVINCSKRPESSLRFRYLHLWGVFLFKKCFMLFPDSTELIAPDERRSGMSSRHSHTRSVGDPGTPPGGLAGHAGDPGGDRAQVPLCFLSVCALTF